MRDLKGSQQTPVKQFMRWQAGNVFALHRDAARGWLKNPGDHVEKGGFSGAIWADQSGDGAFFDGQAGPVNGVKAAEMLVDVFNDDHSGYSP